MEKDKLKKIIKDIREEGTLVINPGEGCGYISGKPTCAVVDLSDMSGRIIEL